MNPVVTVLLPALFSTLFGGLAGSYLTYKVAARRASGTVETSEARELWEQQKEVYIRLQTLADQYTAENARLSDQVRALETENVRLQAQVDQLTLEVIELRKQVFADLPGGAGSGS